MSYTVQHVYQDKLHPPWPVQCVPMFLAQRSLTPVHRLPRSNKSPISYRSSQRSIPLDLTQSTRFLSCSSVKKIRIVVGCNLDHAGTQPLNMNIGPSFFNEDLITASVDCDNGVCWRSHVVETTGLTVVPGPAAFMMRLYVPR